MCLRYFLLFLTIASLLNLPFHGGEQKKEPWSELEKGLSLCGVENILYGTSCFIPEDELERVVRALGIEPLDSSMPELSECCWSMQPGYENGEIFIQICGSDRQACADLWQRLERVVGCRKAGSTRSWSVEAYLSGDRDLLNLGTGLIEALGGRLQGVHINNRMVQLPAYLPWAGEGLFMDEGPVNLLLELYRAASRERVRIRLGLPVLHSPVL